MSILIAVLSVMLNIGLGYHHVKNKNKISREAYLKLYQKSMESYRIHVSEVLSCEAYDVFDVQAAVEQGPLEVYDFSTSGKGLDYKTSLQKSTLEVFGVQIHDTNGFEYCSDVDLPEGHKLLGITIDGDGGNGYDHFVEVDAEFRDVRQYVYMY
jgi:hypothetical protein